MSQDLNIDRMALMVGDEADADLLSDALVEAEFRVTRIGSTGGFLRRGSTTLMCGINASQVDRLSALVKEHCKEREEMVPLQGLPLAGDAAFSSRIVQIRTGGAVIFVLPVERFFKT